MSTQFTIPNFYLVGSLSNLHQNAFVRFTKYIEMKNIKRITIYINSAGGDSNTSMNIYLKLRRLKKQGIHITTIGDLIVKSGAFLIYLVGNIRLAYSDSHFMYHHHYKHVTIEHKLESEDSFNAYINAQKFIEQAKTIAFNNKKIDEEIISITGLDMATLRSLNDLDFDINQALKYNIVHQIIET